jgi:hypothetical protein
VAPDSTSVTVHAGAQQVYVSTEGGGDRSAPQSGSTKLANRNNINIVYNAEIKDISCCTKLWLCCHPCYCGSTFDKDRSYLYIRENSLEGNVATKSCFCGKKDLTFVDYFDRNPYKPSTRCLCIPTEPKLELMQGGCQICCVKVSVVSPGRLSLFFVVEGCSLTFSFFSAVVVRPILWSLCPTKNAAVVFFVAATVLVAVIIFVDSVVVLLATQSLFLRSNRSPRTPHPL